VLDTQECVRADLAVCALVVAVLRAMVAERFTPLARQQAWETEPLAAVLSATIEEGEQALVTDADYAAALGWTEGVPVPAGVLWRHLADTCLAGDDRRGWEEPLEVILGQGPLARRLLTALAAGGARAGKPPPEAQAARPAPDREALARVWGALCDCQAEGRLFVP
jgi:hypothetical protein